MDKFQTSDTLNLPVSIGLNRSHIYAIVKTGEKNIYAYGTNKGLYMIKLHEKTLTQSVISPSDRFIEGKKELIEIRALAYYKDNLLLISFMKEAKIYIYDYKLNKIIETLDSPKGEEFPCKLLSLNYLTLQNYDVLYKKKNPNLRTQGVSSNLFFF